MLVMPLSQHRNATLIIVILWRQTVKLYEKASFVLYSTDMKYTSLRLSDTNNYNYSLLVDLAVPASL